VRKSLECCKQGLVCYSGGSPEDQSADKNADSKDCNPEVSDGMRTLL
jgi:hypothetical protein